MLNDTLDETHHFHRNITKDINSIPEFGPIDDSRYFQSVRIYVHSRKPTSAPSSGPITLLVDDFMLKNKTNYDYFTNGDFELGDGSNWSTNNRSPGYFTQTSDCLQGTYAANLTSKIVIPSYAESTGGFYQYFDPVAKRGLISNKSRDIVINMSWKYNHRTMFSLNEYAYLWLTFRDKFSNQYTLYFILGHNEYSAGAFHNSSNRYYFNSTNNGIQDFWSNLSLDMNEYLAIGGWENVSLTYFGVRVQVIGGSGTFVELLVDELSIVTYPTVDPGFEYTWYDDGISPFIAWDHINAAPGEISAVQQAHAGKYACNITVNDSDDCKVRRKYSNPVIEPNMELDFWW